MEAKAFAGNEELSVSMLKYFRQMLEPLTELRDKVLLLLLYQ